MVNLLGRCILVQHFVKRKGYCTPRTDKRRGLAPVVGVTLMILVGVVALVAIGAFIFTLVNKPQLSPTVSCFDAQTEQPFMVTSACYNVSSKIVHVDVYRVASGYVYDSLLFTLQGAKSSSWTCGKGCGLCTLGKIGETKRYYSLPLDDKPASLEVFANGCSLASSFLSSC